MKKILTRIIKDRKITLFFLIIVLFSGLNSYHIMPRQETPDVSTPAAVITCLYPGASPSDVERLVTRKIEDEVKEIDGLDYYDSMAMDSVSVTLMLLDVGTNLNESFSDLRNKMDDIQSDLPSECEKITINTEWFKTAGMIISLSGQKYSYAELEDYAEMVKKRLSKIPGIEKFDIDGKLDHQITIEVDMNLLNEYGLSFSDLQNVIALQNTEIPSGKLEGETGKITVKTEGTFENIKEIENIILDVSTADGTSVLLKDIANIKSELKDDTRKIRTNDKNAVLLTGYFKKDNNVVLIGKEVEKELEALKAELPSTLTFEKILYQPQTVQNSVNNFIFSLLQGIAFVLVVVFLGMGLRNALVVSVAIPASIITTFTIMHLMGEQIHQLSITALIIALGMLVDNAIVVSDAIQVRIDGDEDKLDACVNGALEVAKPILTSTLTTIAVFLPLMMLDSLAGEFIRSIPTVVTISLMASYFIALLITPTMAYILFKKGNGIEKRSVFRAYYQRLIYHSFLHKKTVALVLISAIVGAVSLSSYLGLEFFPKADTEIVYINLQNDSDTDLAQTEKLCNQVSQILKKEPEVVDWTASIGDSMPKFYYTLPLRAPSKDFAQFLIKVDLSKRDIYKNNGAFISALQRTLDKEITGGRAMAYELEQGEPIGAPVRLKLSGTSNDEIRPYKDLVVAELSKIPGVMNIEDDLDNNIYEYFVDVDMAKANYFGITKYDVQNEVSIALFGRTASVFRSETSDEDIVIKSNIKTKKTLENLMVKSTFTGNKILLKDIAQIKLHPKSPSIKKYNGEVTITISSQVQEGYNSIAIQNELNTRLKTMDLGSITYLFDGEEQSINEEFGNVGSSAVIALLLIYVILLLEFESFLQPFIIFTTIPFSAVGSIVGLYLCRQPLSFTGLLGLVSLFGIVVNNAIVLIDYINHETKAGKPLRQACIDAVDRRFRPIILTTLTTIIGLVPMIINKTALFTPMAIALMSGLMLSTLLTLIVVPLVYDSVMKRSKPVSL